MIKKQLASLLFNKNRTDNDSSTTEQLSDLKQSSSDIIINTLDFTHQTSELSPKTNASDLLDSFQKAARRVKEVLGKSKHLFSELNK
ncbi:hypothetical protein JCM17380_06240 [Desulfosporosinus burensis]